MIYVVLIVLLALAIAGLPHWPYATNWNYGYFPSGVLGLVIIVMLIFWLLGHA